MLLPARFATSVRLERVGLNRLGRGRVELAKHRLAALRDIDEARVAVAPVVEAVTPVARAMQRQTSNHRGRTAATLTAVAVTAAVATVAYVWWRRQEQQQPERLYLGPASWTPVSGISSWDADEADAASATAVMDPPSMPEVAAVDIDMPAAAEDRVDFEEAAVEAVDHEDTSDLTTADVPPAVVDVDAPTPADAEVDATDAVDLATNEPEVDEAEIDEPDSLVTEDTGPAAADENEQAKAPRESAVAASNVSPTNDVAGRRVQAPGDAVAGVPTASSSRPEEEAPSRPVAEPATAKREPQVSARVTPRPVGQALTQPPFPVPSSRPRLPGSWRNSPLP